MTCWATNGVHFLIIKLHIEKKSLEKKYDRGLLETKTHRADIKTFSQLTILTAQLYVEMFEVKHRLLEKAAKK